MNKNAHRSHFLSTSVIIVIIILLGSAVFGYKHYHTSHVITAKNTVKTKQAAAVKTPPQTHTETSDGQTFPVPNNVASGSVQNYTLITQNEDYEIQELNGAYAITLYAIINNPAEQASYQQQLHDYKQEALQYLTQHGVNVDKVSITYDPPEAAQD